MLGYLTSIVTLVTYILKELIIGEIRMAMVHNLSEAAVDEMLYGNRIEAVTNYVQNQLSNFQNTGSQIADRIYGMLNTSYQYLTDNLVRHAVHQELASNNIDIKDNYILSLNTTEQLQQANLTMQRWVMSHPEVKRLYLNNDIDGYSNTYTNIFGSEVGEGDYNYRRVYDEVIVDQSDDTWAVKSYIDDLYPDDRELQFSEKISILSTYDLIDWTLANSMIDFTNQGKEYKERNE